MDLTVIGYHGGSAPANEATSSYLLETKTTRVVLDLGAGALSVGQNLLDVDELEHVLITHYHYDHFSDLGTLLSNRVIKSYIHPEVKPLNIYTQKDRTFSPTFEKEVSTVHYINEKSKLTIGDIEFEFMETEHPVKCLAVKARHMGQTVVYTADSALTQALIQFATGADLMIAECSLYAGFNGKDSGHMNAEDVSELINKSGVKRTVISHLPIYGEHNTILETIQKNTSEKVKLAEKFMKVMI